MKKAKKKENIKKAQKRKKTTVQKRKINLKAIILYFLIVAGFTNIAINQVKHNNMLKEISTDPVKIEALVYKTDRHRRTYYTFYMFCVDGVVYKGKTIDSDLCKTKIGDIIEVQYLRSDPSKNAYIEK
ncbi:MAG: hypothetical protein IKY79_08405 [Bacteroidales bacterium]|nr:hypothetical protein [Bacteroidales bacterium]